MDFKKYLSDADEVSQDKRYKNFSTQLLSLEEIEKADVVIMGIPYDPGTPKHVGAGQGPMGIRDKFSFLRSYSCEQRIDIMEYLKVCDAGNIDVDINNPETTFQHVEKVLRGVYSLPLKPSVLMLGGDHSTSPQNVSDFCYTHPGRTGLIWFDNHLDTMESYHGDKWYCGCPLYRILTENEGSIRGENVVVIGPRGFHHSPEMWEMAEKFGIHVIAAEEVRVKGIGKCIEKAEKIAHMGTEYVYLSFDIDVADPAFAPGTQSPCPGGLLSSELLYGVRTLSKSGINAMDIVEVSPLKDPDGRTCMLAASIALEYMTGLAVKKRGEE